MLRLCIVLIISLYTIAQAHEFFDEGMQILVHYLL